MPDQKQVKSKTRVSEHGEVFTAEREVKAMCDLVKQETERVDSRFLEPACGDGNFLAEIVNRKLAVCKKRCKTPYDFERYSVLAMSSIYGVDILQDNVLDCRNRMFNIWDQGIFGFRKYENSSLSYTGIDKHEGEAVGGWDTVLRREEYEALYSKQQATVVDFRKIISMPPQEDLPMVADIPVSYGAITEKPAVPAQKQPEVKKPEPPKQEPTKPEEPDWMEMLENVKTGVTVKHKKFKEGQVTWMDQARKHIRVKFAEGEKQFAFPNAFIDGYLTL